MTAKQHLEDGLKLAAAGELRDAALELCQAIKEDPDSAEAHQRLGEVLIPLEYWDDAEACFCRALELAPEYPDAHNYLGIVLRHAEKFAEAEQSYRRAIALKPDYAEVYHNLANCLKETWRFAEAEQTYLTALKLQPDLALTRFSLAGLYLLLDRYQQGWPLYETRFSWQGKFRMDVPAWQGQDLSGRNIILYYEQGYGDMLHFIRYAYKVADLAATTAVWIQKPLARLVSGSQNRFAIYTDKKEIDPRQFDYSCSLFSLPVMFNTSYETVPADIPYLGATPEMTAKWRHKISAATGSAYKIGVVWAGNPEHSNDRNRSINTELFSQLFSLPGPAWISLQRDDNPNGRCPRHPNILDYSGELTDFAETAGLLANLDLVIAVDTAVAHLAGAMGKKTWLLLPHFPEWRWGLERENSPWYPTMRLFRQKAPVDWQPVLDDVKKALTALFPR